MRKWALSTPLPTALWGGSAIGRGATPCGTGGCYRSSRPLRLCVRVGNGAAVGVAEVVDDFLGEYKVRLVAEPVLHEALHVAAVDCLRHDRVEHPLLVRRERRA